MKDYLSHYGYTPETSGVRSFQAGGGMPAPAGPAPESGAPAAGPEAGGGDLQAELMQVVETQDPQLALAFCNKLGEQLAAASQGAPEGGMPAEGAPAGPPQEGMGGGGAAPMYKRGGKAGVFSKSGDKVKFARK